MWKGWRGVGWAGSLAMEMGRSDGVSGATARRPGIVVVGRESASDKNRVEAESESNHTFTKKSYTYIYMWNSNI